MSSAARREAIQNSMKQDQRLALEAYVVAAKRREQGNMLKRSRKAPLYAICDVAHRSAAGEEARRNAGLIGICKSSAGGQMYGYYAKVGFENLIFWGWIHRELGEALQDHIILLKLLDKIRCSKDIGFVSKIHSAVASVLAEEGLSESNVLRSVTVRFSAQHWIGSGLSIHFSHLDKALDAWQKLAVARGVPLFRGGHTTAAYTPERAAQQWQRLRQVFVELQTEVGRRDGQRMRRSDVDSKLASLECAYRSTFVKKVARYRNLHQRTLLGKRQPVRIDPQVALYHRFRRLVHTWERKTTREKQKQMRGEVRQSKRQTILNKKRRWDGKESYQDFERRVTRQTQKAD